MRVELVAVVVAPLPEVGEAGNGAEGEEPGPGVQHGAPPHERHEQPGGDRGAEQPRHVLQLGEGCGLDRPHPDVVVQPVDAVQVARLEPGDLIDPDPEPQSLRVLGRDQVDVPERGHIHHQQQQRYGGDRQARGARHHVSSPPSRRACRGSPRVPCRPCPCSSDCST